jgi:predicted regulator of Ras-like GTPase activity (Roadblock/LC7/MglB family)
MTEYLRMFGRIKNLFRRRTEEVPVDDPPSSSFPPREFHPGYTPGARQTAAAAPATAQSESTMEELEHPSTGDSIRLLLKPVLLKLPDALRTRVRQPPVGGVQISIPLQKVLTQLQQGSVKISFGELRQASPAGVFTELNDQDQTPVELPLAEILSQLRPEQLPRRAGQRKIEVPEAVTGLFGSKGEPLTSIRMGSASARGPVAPAPVSQEPVAPIAPEPAPAVAFKPSIPARAPISPISPLAPIRPSQALPSPAALRPPSAVPAAPVTPRAPVTPVAPVTPMAPVTPIAPAVAPAMAMPTSDAQPAAVPVEPLFVPLVRVASAWPAAIKQALAHLPDATLALPSDELEQALKRGKIAFPWQRLRSWITPPPPDTTSAFDDIALELPLSVIAPIFLAQRRPAAAQKKYTITDHIPDVFAGRGREPSTQVQVAAPITPSSPPPAPPAVAMPSTPARPVSAPLPPPAARPTAAPAAAPVAAPAVASVPLPPREIGEVFGQPGRKNWTPSEIVQKTSALRGVTGALIAMQDGLLVAGHLPPGLNAETIAAFLPQMHSRMAQYSKELKFGEANNLTLIMDDVPLKIFKTGGVFFTVLGRPGESLPEPHLNIVAAQLGPQNK